MPLRDHFRPPLDKVLGGKLHWHLARGYRAAVAKEILRAMLVGAASIPVRKSRSMSRCSTRANRSCQRERGRETAVWLQRRSPSSPVSMSKSRCPTTTSTRSACTTDTDRMLVAAIEIVSPANKDRPEHRNVFLATARWLLQKPVAVSIVDRWRATAASTSTAYLVGLHRPCGYDLRREPAGSLMPPRAGCHEGNKRRLHVVPRAPVFRQSLPTLPVWLSQNLSVPFDLSRAINKRR